MNRSILRRSCLNGMSTPVCVLSCFTYYARFPAETLLVYLLIHICHVLSQQILLQYIGAIFTCNGCTFIASLYTINKECIPCNRTRKLTKVFLFLSVSLYMKNLLIHKPATISIKLIIRTVSI